MNRYWEGEEEKERREDEEHGRWKERLGGLVACLGQSLRLQVCSGRHLLHPMSILASPRRSSPEPLPSLPPSPLEEDLGWRAPWSHSDDDDSSPSPDTTNSPEIFQHSKGKEKATKPLPTSYANGGRGEVSQWSNQGRSTEEYPPTTDEATETRRVQEVRIYPVHPPLVPDPFFLDRT
jgi:hypothetical protein